MKNIYMATKIYIYTATKNIYMAMKNIYIWQRKYIYGNEKYIYGNEKYIYGNENIYTATIVPAYITVSGVCLIGSELTIQL